MNVIPIRLLKHQDLHSYFTKGRTDVASTNLYDREDEAVGYEGAKQDRSAFEFFWRQIGNASMTKI